MRSATRSAAATFCSLLMLHMMPRRRYRSAARVPLSRGRGRCGLEFEALIEPPGHAADHDLHRKAQAREAQRAAFGPVAVRTGAVDDEECSGRIGGHARGDD